VWPLGSGDGLSLPDVPARAPESGSSRRSHPRSGRAGEKRQGVAEPDAQRDAEEKTARALHSRILVFVFIVSKNMPHTSVYFNPLFASHP
jgi:hypothetical protein